MVKALTGNKKVILGITEENVRRLKIGQPIILNLSEMGLPDQSICILYGKTEQAIADELKDYLKKDAIIHDER